jgi:hypothetical protein
MLQDYGGWLNRCLKQQWQLSDGQQSITPKRFKKLMSNINKLIEAGIRQEYNTINA